MFDLFKKKKNCNDRFEPKENIVEEKKLSEHKTEINDEKLPDYVKKHVIEDPNKLMIGDYHCFELCKSVPVALDQNSMWRESIIIPNSRVLYDYLDLLEKLPKESREMPLARTVMEYTLSEQYTIKDKKTGKSQDFSHTGSLWMFPTGKIYAKGKALLHVTPEIREDIKKRLHAYKSTCPILTQKQNDGR